MKTNPQRAFEMCVLWLKNDPHDYKGAIEAASDFIDSVEDVDELEKMIREAGGIE